MGTRGSSKQLPHLTGSLLPTSVMQNAFLGSKQWIEDFWSRHTDLRDIWVAMTFWYLTMPWGNGTIWGMWGQDKMEPWLECVCVYMCVFVCVCMHTHVRTHIFCNHFAILCFMELLHYWLLGWFILMQRWEEESHRGKRDFPTSETHGPVRMNITLLVLSRETPWLS